MDKVDVSGDQNNSHRTVLTNHVLTIDANDTVTVSWWILVQPLLPFMFIAGMIGLGSMFGGSMYAVTLFKKHKYKEGFIEGVTFVCIGTALFISWVYT